MNLASIKKIAIYRRLHTDNICAVFLLKEFGEEKFRGIKEAMVELWDKTPDGKTADELENEGIICVDMGGGKFDHHHDDHETKKTDCASTMIARYLGVDDMPALKKILTFVKRDDLEGRGIVSKDLIDRAFGLPALILNLSKAYPDHPEYVIDIVVRIFQAHYYEQYRRTVLMPAELQELKKSGKYNEFLIAVGLEKIKVACVETDSETMAGFLRAFSETQADIVVVKKTTGHINLITKDRKPRFDLRGIIREIRIKEAEKKGINLDITESELEKPGRLAEIPEWYYDTAANTLQNGGAASSESVERTQLTLGDIKVVLQDIFNSVART